jgi:hypothetical protein
MTKINDIRAINSLIAELQAVTANMTLAEKRVLLESLTSDIQAAASVVDAPKRRLESVKAAAVATDQRTKEAFRTAVSMLKRLGLEIDAICASGDISSLDEKMRALKWDSVRRIQLKNSLGIIGYSSLICQLCGVVSHPRGRYGVSVLELPTLPGGSSYLPDMVSAVATRSVVRGRTRSAPIRIGRRFISMTRRSLGPGSP